MPKVSEQNHRNRDHRNERSPQVLQEDEKHDEDENDRFDERMHHLLDGQFHKRRRVVGIGNDDVLRKRRGDAVNVAFTRAAVSSALAPVARLTAKPVAGLRLEREFVA